MPFPFVVSFSLMDRTLGHQLFFIPWNRPYATVTLYLSGLDAAPPQQIISRILNCTYIFNCSSSTYKTRWAAHQCFEIMSFKKKRKLEATDASSDRKRVRTSRDMLVKRDLLDRCYDKVTTLREYILLKLPPRSRLRRKKVASVGEGDDVGELESNLSRLLDTSLVCFDNDQQNVKDVDMRKKQLIEFTQKGDESYVSLSDGISGSVFSQDEVSIAFP